MLARNRFQYELATGRATLPVTIIICLIMYGITYQEKTDLLSLAIHGAIVYCLIELNTTFSLIRTRTTLHAALFLFFLSGLPFLHTYSHEQWIPLLFTVSFSYLFRSYESVYAPIPVFHCFLCLGISSFLLPQVLYFVPLIYFYMIGLRAFTLRTFFAGLIGLLVPYWIALAYHLYAGNMEATWLPFKALAHFPPIDYAILSLSQLVSGGIAILFIAICSVECILHSYQDKVQTRIMLRVLIITGIGTLACMLLLPSHFNTYFLMTLVVGSVMGGHLLALTFNRFTRIFLWVSLGIWTCVLLACIGLGLDPVWSTLFTTAGNALGGFTCYWIGRIGKTEWIEKYFKVDKKQMDKAIRFIHGRGSWMAFFSFLPVIGDALLIALGFMRGNVWITTIAMTIGKLARYAIIVATALGVFRFIG